MSSHFCGAAAPVLLVPLGQGSYAVEFLLAADRGLELPAHIWEIGGLDAGLVGGGGEVRDIVRRVKGERQVTCGLDLVIQSVAGAARNLLSVGGP